ncbi:hypothetical protein PHYSODRAFT_307828 [Phytophthora sojae]|uniref:Uncharacterized protein n=1 Tax=Phytophthora sojae (strain P6497) TaxID=1094619 RepID=G5AG89_PHYSP|nr:hypothetical protein PHYSODRAFT_307828 [Phytophthora sojae]EGZ05601.1 hypothetical protein PHYSODRAFT_307828 [Phytophthora sojae]|eukprot:XP_009539132.1 hypothetical protein PHYSODRAFT_307828 [Phytophthora sojae]
MDGADGSLAVHFREFREDMARRMEMHDNALALSQRHHQDMERQIKNLHAELEKANRLIAGLRKTIQEQRDVFDAERAAWKKDRAALCAMLEFHRAKLLQKVPPLRKDETNYVTVPARGTPFVSKSPCARPSARLATPLFPPP